jgi:transposase-like protein
MGSNKIILCPHGVLGKRQCKECCRIWQRAWRKKGNNAEKARKATARWAANNLEYKRADTRRRLGIPEEGGITKYGNCPLCDQPDKLVPDHNHKTGKLRGWLCGNCNRALGVVEKYFMRLAKFKQWIEKDGNSAEPKK